MERKAIEQLIKWQKSEDRKPLILKGARQVGKTWLMREFGNSFYDDCVEFNFDKDVRLNSIFENTKDPFKIIEMLGIFAGKKIEPGKTLIIFDEIQECSEALNSLKYFNEEANGYHVIAAGSLLGTMLAQPRSYPVGKVNLLKICPLDFEEYLAAIDCNLCEYYRNIKITDVIPELFHNMLLEHYNKYLIVGGMPECVDSWVNSRNIEYVEKKQRDLLALYENDIAKHNGKINTGRVLLVLRSIASQLGKENEKFIYGALKSGGRAREFEEAIEWLVSAGLLNRIYNISKPEHPLPVMDILDCFKLFWFDTGLIKQQAGVDNKAILTQNDYRFKGPLTENYILQQFIGKFDVEPRYFSWKYGELDFVIQYGSEIIPIEVKGGEKKSAASFKSYIKKALPQYAIRFSKMNLMTNGSILNIPLYLAPRLTDFLS